jgi:hypothetical protein
MQPAGAQRFASDQTALQQNLTGPRRRGRDRWIFRRGNDDGQHGFTPPTLFVRMPLGLPLKRPLCGLWAAKACQAGFVGLRIDQNLVD